MKRLQSYILLGVLLAFSGCSPQTGERPPEDRAGLKAVPFTAVRVDDSFWRPRIETNRTVTIPTNFEKSEETGRISNFARAGGLEEGPHQGLHYDDSDVFKIIEGAAYSLSQTPDPKLEAYLDDLIAKIAAAQEEDGYLYTIRTLEAVATSKRAGQERWSYLVHSHELYNVGHLYEAAVAHYRATGKRTLLDVAIENADLITEIFGPGKNHDVPGHQEIEIGLAKLYQVTGEEKYLQLAKFFLDQRGHGERRSEGGRLEDPTYNQDHASVVEQNEAVGHAVRALYQYSGMADVAVLTGDDSYLPALRSLWEDVVYKKTYITGGVGSRRGGESFGTAYELPNASAYNETCAAVASILWNYRLFLLHRDAGYLDVVERTLYNGFLSGVSLKGDTFFYPNPLAADGKTEFNQGSGTRQPWFNTSCCPTNVSRFLPSLPGYLYATEGNDLYINLFAGSQAQVDTQSNRLTVTQRTGYPWEGEVNITIRPERVGEFNVYLRIPGWARNEPSPGGLYSYDRDLSDEVSIEVNGEAVAVGLKQGFARIRRRWQAEDTIRLRLPVAVRRVRSRQEVATNAGLVALERGPLVYCVEGVDNGGTVKAVHLKPSAEFRVSPKGKLLGGVHVIEWDGFTAVPYYAWSNRGVGDMAVWLPEESPSASH